MLQKPFADTGVRAQDDEEDDEEERPPRPNVTGITDSIRERLFKARNPRPEGLGISLKTIYAPWFGVMQAFFALRVSLTVRARCVNAAVVDVASVPSSASRNRGGVRSQFFGMHLS
jgi:hypothetical protein